MGLFLGNPDFKGRTIVVDIGKTNAKMSLWSKEGALIDRKLRANNRQPATIASYPILDVQGIDAWLLESMREFAKDGSVAQIVTVGHGAAAALLLEQKLYADPMDYEIEVSEADREEYDRQRDPFEETGSPALPLGLNLGVQLHLLEKELGPFPDDLVIVPWAQYWAWRFSGVASTEITSLGCHSDLWRPGINDFSELATRRGWAARMAPLRQASDTLGRITPELAIAAGLNDDCEVLCGLHDSNAALLAARGHAEIAHHEATVLSTGTWFVAMRSLSADSNFDISKVHESRDCLVNVDVFARPTPSARFMGGREAELAGGVDSFRLTDSCEPEELIDRLPSLIERGCYAIPGFVAGVGPFPNAAGTWLDRPTDPVDLRAATDLYLALVADTALTLIGSQERLLIEGRFAEDAVFVRALAALRPDQHIYISNADHDVAFGALRLMKPDLALETELTTVEPLELDLENFATSWRERARLAQEAT
jgi:sugar (pentulose or hexulose) kinase